MCNCILTEQVTTAHSHSSLVGYNTCIGPSKQVSYIINYQLTIIDLNITTCDHIIIEQPVVGEVGTSPRLTCEWDTTGHVWHLMKSWTDINNTKWWYCENIIAWIMWWRMISKAMPYNKYYITQTEINLTHKHLLCKVASFEVALLTMLEATQLYLPHRMMLVLDIIKVEVLAPDTCMYWEWSSSSILLYNHW